MGVPVTVFSLLLVLIYHPVCWCLLLGREREKEKGERGVARYLLVGNTFRNQTRYAHDVGILF